MEDLKYYNEYGGFSQDGKEYCIKVNSENSLPTVWSLCMANENFGTIVTENMGGFTYYKNSRLGKITAWSNDAIIDSPSEIIYMQDEDTSKTWTITSSPMPDEEDYFITYGFGYAKYKHISSDIYQEAEVFVPQKDTVKLHILKLRNNIVKAKKIKII